MTLTDHKDFWNIVATCAAAIAVAFCFWISQAHKLSYSIHDPNPAFRAAAVRAMERDGNENQLIGALKDDDLDVRIIAIQKLGGQGSTVAIRAESLISSLKDDRLSIRQGAASSLSTMGKDAWPALNKALLDQNSVIRAGAAHAIANVHHPKDFDTWTSRERETIAPVLEKLTADEDLEVRLNAKEALESMPRRTRQ